MTEFYELINRSQPGTMVQHLFSLSAGADWVAGLAVRESWEILARLPRRLDIHSRGAVIQIQNVHLILLMLRFEGQIYETFVSIQHPDSAEFVARMAEQRYFSILLFDGVSAQPVSAYVTQNGFQSLFQFVGQSFALWPGWYFHEFDEAKAALYARYPTMDALWQALDRRSGSCFWLFSSPGVN